MTLHLEEMADLMRRVYQTQRNARYVLGGDVGRLVASRGHVCANCLHLRQHGEAIVVFPSITLCEWCTLEAMEAAARLTT